MRNDNDLDSRPQNGRHPENSRSGASRSNQNRTNSERPNRNNANGNRKRVDKAALKKKRKKRRIIILIIEILLVLILLAVAYVFSKTNKIHHTSISEKDVNINKMDDTAKEVLSGYTNIALFGLDNRTNGDLESGNSDSIMIASINNDTKEVRLLSVYRDSYINVYDNYYAKANSAYAKGGPKYAISMLNRNLDLDIKNYVSVDFNALVDAVDAVGGIELTVTDEEVKVMNGQTGHEDYIAENEKITGKKSTHLKHGGTYNLDGIQATAYCRLRYLKGDDFARAQRQRTVLSALIAKAKESNPAQLNKLIDSMVSKVSTSFSATDIISLVSQMRDYTLVSVPGFPYDKRTGTISKATGSVVIPCDLVSNVTQLHKQLFNDDSYTPSSTVKAINAKIIAKSGFSAKNAIKTSDPTEGSTQTQQTTEISN